MADTVTPQGVVAVVPAVPGHAQGPARRRLAPRRDPRGGARPRQRGHHHPGGGCRGRRRRDPHRPQRRPLQPQGRALDDRLALPPPGRPGRRRSSTRSQLVRAAGLQVLAADIKGEDLPDAAPTSSPQPTAWLFGNEAHGLTDEHARARRPGGQGADLRPRRVDEPRDGRLGLPLRERVRPAHLSRARASARIACVT